MADIAYHEFKWVSSGIYSNLTVSILYLCIYVLKENGNVHVWTDV